MASQCNYCDWSIFWAWVFSCSIFFLMKPTRFVLSNFREIFSVFTSQNMEQDCTQKRKCCHHPSLQHRFLILLCFCENHQKKLPAGLNLTEFQVIRRNGSFRDVGWWNSSPAIEFINWLEWIRLDFQSCYAFLPGFSVSYAFMLLGVCVPFLAEFQFVLRSWQKYVLDDLNSWHVPTTKIQDARDASIPVRIPKRFSSKNLTFCINKRTKS